MYAVPAENEIQQHIEIRNEQIGSHKISGAIMVDETGQIKFRLDMIKPEIVDIEKFKKEMTDFVKKLNIMKK
jgi:hypothetical protein